MRLTAATKLVRYYAMVGRPLTPANMAWNTVMRNFNEQWKALEERKENENPDVPKITKALPVIKWTEAFTDNLSRAIGVRMIPLAYDKISTSLVECEHVKAKIGKALRADGSPRMWKKLPPARGQKGFLS